MYAAHDDLSIYGIGSTAEEALEDAQRFADGEFQVSKIETSFGNHIKKYGFNGAFEAFDFDESRTIVAPSDD